MMNTIDESLSDRIRGCAVGAVVGDALGMPLEFGPRQPESALVREMETGRLPAGTFTDDTEMALALAESLMARKPLDPEDLAQRFVEWYQSGPPDIGIHTSSVLARIAQGEPWKEAVTAVQSTRPDSAGNGSVMRCWPVALAYHRATQAPYGQEQDVRLLETLVAESRLQSRVTHPHPECQVGSAFVNVTIFHLLHGMLPAEAVARALDDAAVPRALREVIEVAPTKSREMLPNTGWVRHTVESAVWGLLTTPTFEEAVVAVVNLGKDADTAGTVVGALAGAAYGLSAIPQRWQEQVWGTWRGRHWLLADVLSLADRLAAT